MDTSTFWAGVTLLAIVVRGRHCEDSWDRVIGDMAFFAIAIVQIVIFTMTFFA